MSLQPRPIDIAHAKALAALKQWGAEAAANRADEAINLARDRARNAFKSSPAYDAAVALRDLQRQINEGGAL
jgi:hypothetical protein